MAQSKSPTAAHQRYRNAKGTVVPGVTTVIALLAKPALITWAWKLGMQGEDMNKVRDKAADIGTCVHYLCECALKGQTAELRYFTQDTLERAHPLVEEFESWFKTEKLTLVASECDVVSEAWQFGGCIDIIAKKPNELWLCDIKTSKGIYDEYKIQLAAYKAAWEENNPDKPIDAIKVVHLDKFTGHLQLYTFGDLTTEFEIFKHLRAVYALQKRADPNRDRQAKAYRKTSKLGGAL